METNCPSLYKTRTNLVHLNPEPYHYSVNNKQFCWILMRSVCIWNRPWRRKHESMFCICQPFVTECDIQRIGRNAAQWEAFSTRNLGDISAVMLSIDTQGTLGYVMLFCNWILCVRVCVFVWVGDNVKSWVIKRQLNICNDVSVLLGTPSKDKKHNQTLREWPLFHLDLQFILIDQHSLQPPHSGRLRQEALWGECVGGGGWAGATNEKGNRCQLLEP